jgi:hypothetical protein
MNSSLSMKMWIVLLTPSLAMRLPLATVTFKLLGCGMGCRFRRSTMDVEMNKWVEPKSIKALMVAPSLMFQWGICP